MKIKRYRLAISRYFPSTHPRKGEKTYFDDKILKRYSDFNNFLGWQKIHTIRANYPLWAKRMAEVQAGLAVIELFYWSGSPYNSRRDGSKQVVFATLDKDSGCGVQKIEIGEKCNSAFKINGMYLGKSIEIQDLSKNDGLSLEDFKAWFKGYDLSKSMAIIHFTDFRY